MSRENKEGWDSPPEGVADGYNRMEKDLTALANSTRNIVLPRNRNFSRRDVVSAFQCAFEMIGGVPRLALWAHDNPGEFYKLYGKLLPSATAVEILPSGGAGDSGAPLKSYTTEQLEHMLAERFEQGSPLEESAQVIPFPAEVLPPEDDE